MAKALIIVQDAQFTVAQLKELEAKLKRNYQKHVTNNSSLRTIWMTASKGSAVTNFKLSQSSIIVLEVPNRFNDETRTLLLKDCFSDWASVTGQSPDHILISALDQREFLQSMWANLSRLSWQGKLRYFSKTAFNYAKSKRKHGLLISSLNLN